MRGWRLISQSPGLLDLHFGKPLGECISSVFGGYILGVIALYSRNIWGGVVLHMGVAALMELAAFSQLLIRN